MQKTLQEMMEIRQEQLEHIAKIHDLQDKMRKCLEEVEWDIIKGFDNIYQGDSKTSLDFKDIGDKGICLCIEVARSNIPIYQMFEYLKDCGFKMENMILRIEDFDYIICFPIDDLV